VQAIEESNGLAATEFSCFEPKQLRKVEVDITDMSLLSILLTTLDPGRGLNNNSTLAFKQGGFGSGVRINPALGIKFAWCKITSKKKKKADLTQLPNVYNEDVSMVQLLAAALIL
jgi:hypothetical protein